MKKNKIEIFFVKFFLCIGILLALTGLAVTFLTGVLPGILGMSIGAVVALGGTMA